MFRHHGGVLIWCSRQWRDTCAALHQYSMPMRSWRTSLQGQVNTSPRGKLHGVYGFLFYVDSPWNPSVDFPVACPAPQICRKSEHAHYVVEIMRILTLQYTGGKSTSNPQQNLHVTHARFAAKSTAEKNPALNFLLNDKRRSWECKCYIIQRITTICWIWNIPWTLFCMRIVTLHYDSGVTHR